MWGSTVKFPARQVPVKACRLPQKLNILIRGFSRGGPGIVIPVAETCSHLSWASSLFLLPFLGVIPVFLPAFPIGLISEISSNLFSADLFHRSLWLSVPCTKSLIQCQQLLTETDHPMSVRCAASSVHHPSLLEVRIIPERVPRLCGNLPLLEAHVHKGDRGVL